MLQCQSTAKRRAKRPEQAETHTMFMDWKTQVWWQISAKWPTDSIQFPNKLCKNQQADLKIYMEMQRRWNNQSNLKRRIKTEDFPWFQSSPSSCGAAQRAEPWVSGTARDSRKKAPHTLPTDLPQKWHGNSRERGQFHQQMLLELRDSHMRSKRPQPCSAPRVKVHSEWIKRCKCKT